MLHPFLTNLRIFKKCSYANCETMQSFTKTWRPLLHERIDPRIKHYLQNAFLQIPCMWRLLQPLECSGFYFL